MTTATIETDQTLALFKQIEVLEDVAERVDESDRVRIRQIVQDQLNAASPVRVVAAAQLLDISDKTVRSWVNEGVLAVATSTPRLLLDANALHAVFHVVKEIRAAGQTRALLDEVYRRLVDATWLEREDLAESLEQMRRGEAVVRVKKVD
jgi:hypothetical protein